VETPIGPSACRLFQQTPSSPSQNKHNLPSIICTSFCIRKNPIRFLTYIKVRCWLKMQNNIFDNGVVKNSQYCMSLHNDNQTNVNFGHGPCSTGDGWCIDQIYNVTDDTWILFLAFTTNATACTGSQTVHNTSDIQLSFLIDRKVDIKNKMDRRRTSSNI
jgi:hypothetical protein